MGSALQAVLLRSADDLSFREAIRRGDRSELDRYDLSSAEARAVMTGDERHLFVLLGDANYVHIREQGNYCCAED